MRGCVREIEIDERERESVCVEGGGLEEGGTEARRHGGIKARRDEGREAGRQGGRKEGRERGREGRREGRRGREGGRGRGGEAGGEGGGRGSKSWALRFWTGLDQPEIIYFYY